MKENTVIFGIDLKSERSQRQIGYLALVAGLVAAAGGIFGLWIQGTIMYDGTPLHTIADVLCFQDIYASIFLPSFVILIGGFLLSWVILASKLTEKFSTAKRNVLFAAFAAILLIAILVVSKIAAGQDWARASAGATEYFKSKYPQTNAPTALPVVRPAGTKEAAHSSLRDSVHHIHPSPSTEVLGYFQATWPTNRIGMSRCALVFFFQEPSCPAREPLYFSREPL